MFSPYLLQVSVTQHSSVTLRQLSFGEATSRPHGHAAPEGPLSSFWGYVGHWSPSGRYFPPAFLVFTLSHNRHMPYPENGHFGHIDHDECEKATPFGTFL